MSEEKLIWGGMLVLFLLQIFIMYNEWCLFQLWIEHKPLLGALRKV
jgi:hypothetical protein